MPSIDFGLTKEIILMDDVLFLIGWTGHREPCGSLRGPCPVHKSNSAASRSLVITGGQWYCHSCKKGGDKLSLYAQVAGLPVYEATVQLCERLHIAPKYQPRKTANRKSRNSEEAS